MLVRLGFIQIALVILTMWVAAKRNRNPGGWGLAALFFPLLALIVLAFLPPLAQVAPRVQPPGEPLRVCNQCGTAARETAARYCTACGKQL